MKGISRSIVDFPMKKARFPGPSFRKINSLKFRLDLEAFELIGQRGRLCDLWLVA